MKKYFITSDIHSFYSILRENLEQKGFDINNQEHILVICGDLFDRGDETVELFNFVKSFGDRFVYIRGNHEDLLEECVSELAKGYTPSRHHFSNGTIKTICQFCNSNEWIIYDRSNRDFILKTMTPVLEYINSKAVDYFDINNDLVCVHGWWPAYATVDDYHNAPKYFWKDARWENGMDCWKNPKYRIPDKTVICGHWHCSWGWSVLRQQRKEFPPMNRANWQESFEPFIDDGIMAIDACTAYTKLMNIIVVEEK